MTTYSELCLVGGDAIVNLRDTDSDHEAFIPRAQIASWTVDWLVESGKIAIVTTSGETYLTIFDQGDGGVACADAISELCGVGVPISRPMMIGPF